MSYAGITAGSSVGEKSMKNVVAYCRVSTSKEDQLNSLAAQKLFFEEFIKKQSDYNLVGIYADEGLSGTKIKNRKDFQRMLKDAQKGAFDILLVKDISRFARNTVDFLTAFRHLKDIGVQVIFVNYNMSATESSEMVYSMLAVIAQEESHNTSVRIKAAKKANAEKGRVPNMVYGYDKTPKNIFDLQINEKEALTIRQIFEWYVNEAHGAVKIASMLNNRGIKTKKRSNWSQNAITRILRNEIYTGRVINGKQEVKDFLTGKRIEKKEEDWYIKDNPTVAIIDRELFDKAQRMLVERNDLFKHGKTRHSNTYTFSTLIKCKDCNYSFRRISRTYQNTYNTWVCSYRNLNGVNSCLNATVVAEEDLIKAIRDYFTGIVSNKATFTKNILDKFNTMYRNKMKTGNSEPELMDHISAIDKKRGRYMELYTDGLITKKEVMEKVEGLLEQRNQLEAELRLIPSLPTGSDRAEEIIHNAIKDIETVLAVEDMTNAQLRRIVDRIEVDHSGNVDIFLKLVDEIGLEKVATKTLNRT